MRILLVEHNIEMLRLLKSMIAEIADEIFESNSGDDAVSIYGSVKPDWVVMDIYRRPANGISTAARIKAVDTAAKIAFVSNFTDDRTREWAAEVGGTAFFGKDDLLSLVEFLKKEKENSG